MPTISNHAANVTKCMQPGIKHCLNFPSKANAYGLIVGYHHHRVCMAFKIKTKTRNDVEYLWIWLEHRQKWSSEKHGIGSYSTPILLESREHWQSKFDGNLFLHQVHLYFYLSWAMSHTFINVWGTFIFWGKSFGNNLGLKSFLTVQTTPKSEFSLSGSQS